VITMRNTKIALWMAAAAFVGPVACVPDDPEHGGEPGADEGWQLRGPCEPRDRVGGFEVVHEPTVSSVQGQVYDSVLPSLVYEEIAASGPCRILQPPNPHCDPACDEQTQVCDVDGTCILHPAPQDVGAVDIEGLLVDDEMTSSADNSWYYFDTQVPHPPFEPAARVRLGATGGEVDPFVLYGEGVEMLKITDQPWTLGAGQPLRLAWTPASTEHASVLFVLNIDQHGSTPANLTCDLHDSGNHEVPAELVDALMAQGVSGAPNPSLVRRTIDSVSTALGCVELGVFSVGYPDLVVGSSGGQ